MANNKLSFVDERQSLSTSKGHRPLALHENRQATAVIAEKKLILIHESELIKANIQYLKQNTTFSYSFTDIYHCEFNTIQWSRIEHSEK